MDKLKSSIEEANLAVSAEREKNVSLLHLIFPPDIAKRLWLGKYFNLKLRKVSLHSNNFPFLKLFIRSYNFIPIETQFLLSGETIEAKTYPEVTMLFSDIVGFTEICSTATPMMVINMLQNLYEQFDSFCGQLDVYKVRVLFYFLSNYSNFYSIIKCNVSPSFLIN